MAATLYPHWRPVSGCWVAVRRIHIGRVKENTAELAGLRPCLKAAWLAGRAGGELAAAFYPERKAAVGRWVAIRGIYFKHMNIGRIKEKTVAVPALFRPCLITPVLVGGICVVASFDGVSGPAVGCWVPKRGLGIKKMKIGRIKEKTAAVPARFRPSLRAAGLAVGREEKSY